MHPYNDLHIAAPDFGDSLGVCMHSHAHSENNVWETAASMASSRLVRIYKGSTFFDRGSLHNGQPVEMLRALQTAGATLTADIACQPTPHGPLDAAPEAAARARAGAGAGRIWTAPD